MYYSESNNMIKKLITYKNSDLGVHWMGSHS